jgi:outer membrane protein assembly complex protein YaeT
MFPPGTFAGQASPPSSQVGSPDRPQTAPVPPLDAIAVYRGLVVREIRFSGLPVRDQDRLRRLLPQQAGQPLERDKVRASVAALYNAGLFSDIQVEAERSADNQVVLTFETVLNHFVGDVSVEGLSGRPTPNQVISSTKLELGEIYTSDSLERARTNILQLMADNGYPRAAVTQDEHPHPETRQMDLLFRVSPGPQARVGEVRVSGSSTFTSAQVQEIAKMHTGDRVTADRVSNALERLRKKYLKQNRLLVQVSVAERHYVPAANTVDYTFRIEPGPTVDIVVEGFKIRSAVLKKRIPVYEENALDDDLLNEGRRNLLDYLQTRGFFEASVGVKKQSAPEHNELRVIYAVDPGPRHKLMEVSITGNKAFTQQQLRARMQVQPKTRLVSNGRYSQSLLAGDVSRLERLYRSIGYRDVHINASVEDNFQGKPREIAVHLDVEEGPLTLVRELHIVGNERVSAEELRSRIYTLPGQAYSDEKLTGDRDLILNYYFNNGFPNATLAVAAEPIPNLPDRMDVTFNIREGERFFVDQVLVSGLEHTRPSVVQRKLKVSPGNPLSQQDLLNTQSALYDLGIFSQVDTAVQNPDGSDPSKNVLVDIHEAKRYTFDYGLGLEFQTGQPSSGANVPQGKTGVSPRVSLEITRLNLRGINHTLAFKGHLGNLQQRALVTYTDPSAFNNEKLTLSFTAFYDNTVDVTTFTSKRLEGSVQLRQVLGNAEALPGARYADTLIYAVTYRRVQASNLVIDPNLIPVLSQPTRVGFPGFTWIHDKRNDPLQTTKGNYTTLDMGVAGRYFGSESSFSKLLIQNATYHPFGHYLGNRFVLARSTHVGIQNAFSNTLILEPDQPVPPGYNLIPLPERFLSGGGNSHRGFGLNQAGPRDLISGYPLGGSALFLNQLELRLPPFEMPFVQDNLNFVLFHDMGNVFASSSDMVNNFFRWRQKNPNLCLNEETYTQCDFRYISHALGVGVNYKTPIGPVRFDFGYNLNPPAYPSFQTLTNEVNGVTTTTQFFPRQLSHFNVFFSIGQSF